MKTVRQRVFATIDDTVVGDSRHPTYPRNLKGDETLDSLGADSLEVVEVRMALETEFKIDLGDLGLDETLDHIAHRVSQMVTP